MQQAKAVPPRRATARRSTLAAVVLLAAAALAGCGAPALSPASSAPPAATPPAATPSSPAAPSATPSATPSAAFPSAVPASRGAFIAATEGTAKAAVDAVWTQRETAADWAVQPLAVSVFVRYDPGTSPAQSGSLPALVIGDNSRNIGVTDAVLFVRHAPDLPMPVGKSPASGWITFWVPADAPGHGDLLIPTGSTPTSRITLPITWSEVATP
jgi:hypothetical protein